MPPLTEALAAPTPHQEPEFYCTPGQPSIACRIAWEATHNADFTEFFRAWLDRPLTGLVKVAITVLIAFMLRRIAHRIITKVTLRMAEGTVPERPHEKTRTIFDGSPVLITERRRQRAKTMGSVMRSVASIVILGTAVMSVLGTLGVNIAPILASASVIGVAVGFGAQSIVKDFVSGIFMLLEDQYGVGDVIDVGPAKGTVEAVSLRITRLRDVDGMVWYVRNGEIQRVGNESQNWARAVLDFPVSVDASLDQVRTVLKSAADALAAEPPWNEIIIEEPSVSGVQALTGDAMVVRVVLKTAPGRQAEVARQLRERVKKSFDEVGVTVAALPA